MTLHPIPLNFLIYEENFLFFLSEQHDGLQLSVRVDNGVRIVAEWSDGVYQGGQ